MNFARFYLSELLPSVTGRIIYLDDDVIVQANINSLFHLPMQPGSVLLASSDPGNTMDGFLNFSVPVIKKTGIDPSAFSFNAGVFVCDLDEWRAQGITKKLLYWMELNKELPIYGLGRGGGASQPPMLLALHDKVGLAFFQGYNPPPSVAC